MKIPKTGHAAIPHTPVERAGRTPSALQPKKLDQITQIASENLPNLSKSAPSLKRRTEAGDSTIGDIALAKQLPTHLPRTKPGRG